LLKDTRFEVIIEYSSNFTSNRLYLNQGVMTDDA